MLNTQHYKVWIKVKWIKGKWCDLGNEVVPSPTPGVVAMKREPLSRFSTTAGKHYILNCFKIYLWNSNPAKTVHYIKLFIRDKETSSLIHDWMIIVGLAFVLIIFYNPNPPYNRANDEMLIRILLFLNKSIIIIMDHCYQEPNRFMGHLVWKYKFTCVVKKKDQKKEKKWQPNCWN